MIDTIFDGYSIFPPREDGTFNRANQKQQLLWSECMPDDIREEAAHFHDLDIVLHSGTTGSGKSVGTVARALYICKKYPGATVICVARTYKQLEDTFIKDLKRILVVKKGSWRDHPWVKQVPNQQNKTLTIGNYDENGDELADSQIIFKGVESDPTSVLSMQADLVIIEEAQRLFDAEALEVLITRMRSVAAPFKQIILNINPHNEDFDWLYDRFSLEQHEEGYKGDPVPIGKPCGCHFCEICELRDERFVEYVDGACPECGYKKRNACPGKQHNSRVIFSNFLDNLENLPPTYARDIKKNMTGANMAAYGTGTIKRKAGNKCYERFTQANMEKKNLPIDPNADIYWHLDHNRRPACSGVSQIQKVGPYKHVYIKEELLVWNADIEDVARAFIVKFKPMNLQGWIHIYCDPQMFRDYTKGKEHDGEIAKIFKLQKYLKEAGFKKVRLGNKNTVYGIEHRIDSVNDMMSKQIEGEEEPLVRVHVNPKCFYHKWSFERVKWNKAGSKEDETQDFKARDRGNPGEEFGLTHPAAAFGYWMVVDYPSVPQSVMGESPVHASFTETGGSITDIDEEGEVRSRDMDEIDDDDFDSDPYGDEDEDEEDLNAEPDDYNTSWSIGGFLRSSGLSIKPPKQK